MICLYENCERPPYKKGYCNAHYIRQRRGKDMNAPIRDVAYDHPETCSIDGCDNPYDSKGLCDTHRTRKRRGIADLERPIGIPAPKPRLNGNGYISRTYKKPDGSRGHILEHRAIMEELIGRKLRPGENVHHRNGVRTDNRPSNLELWATLQPKGQRPKDLLEWAREIIELYGPLEEEP